MGKDYYAILGLGKNASAEEIKSAYKKLAKKFHPDVSSEANAEEKFKEVQEAYSVLSDPQKKSSYDQFGSDFSKFGGAGPGFGGFDFSGGDFGFEDLFSGFSGFRDIFDMFGRRQSHGPRKGVDIQVKLNLDFEEAVFGAEKEIKLERVEQCPACQGSGAEKGSDIITCPDCQGRGVKQVIRKTFLGVISTASTCPKCRGEGKVIQNPCSKCKGSGHTKAKRKIKVKVPAGIDTGNTLRLAEEGHAGERGGLSGDVYVIMFVEPHEVFKRDGSDVLCEIPLTFSEAALGMEIEVPTLKGKAVLKVPAGTQTSTIFRMKDKGIKALGRDGYGDQYVKVNVQTPGRLSKAQRKIFEELAGTEETKKKRKSFFDSLKKSFKS